MTGKTKGSSDNKIDLQNYTLIKPEPEHCPGPESENAGKSDSCTGCANKTICESLPKGPDPDIPLITDNLSCIKHKILILSGKGGVGKSTFTAMLTWGLSSCSATVDNEDVDTSELLNIGCMDLDICGPSMPRMFGCHNELVHESNTGLTPVYVTENLATMSIQYMLPEDDSAIIWRGPKKNALIKKFLKDVDWSNDGDGLDYLIIDTPPGTSDEHITINNYLKESGIDGALIVTTPQEVALLDVRKEIDFCFKTGIKILGVVENMSGFVCPNCQNESRIFKPTTGGAMQLCKELNLPFMGSVPLDPRIRKCCDSGMNFIDVNPDSPATDAILDILFKLREKIEL
ncbi:probable Cytosolic Fe-S cluster assembly factor NBP35 [Saccharomycodes ludwigii]|uniref:Probable Cytosolic Fe-S cluster assembly factor NBP35 n=1 Tax=Saccharomycodes ludwigii TaxID=36035 RepID=A0A376B4B7_9ASCO|nr:hypothetical protein SCDLUD_001078 [Saccharomycodes ludwigii]KAH3903439.1 hypothetical protein SCDLUD_001078 [Saccharomycodes ludwigii]SSD58950.1 probable Cytosolic Fe-S cluster assembly factor NBP35 [Saccharomycodes ludwigii]